MTRPFCKPFRPIAWIGILLIGMSGWANAQQPPIQSAWRTGTLHQFQPMGWFQQELDVNLSGPLGHPDSLVDWQTDGLDLSRFPARFWPWWRSIIGYALMEHNSTRKDIIHQQVKASQNAWMSSSSDWPADPSMIHAWLDWAVYARDTSMIRTVHQSTANLLARWQDPAVYPPQGNPELLDLLFDLVQVSDRPSYREMLVHLATVPVEGTPLQQLYPKLMAWSMTGQHHYRQDVDRLMDGINDGIQPGGIWSPSTAASSVGDEHSPCPPADQLLLLNIYHRLLVLTGRAEYADQAEQLALNGLAGFAHPEHPVWSRLCQVNTPADPDGSLRTTYTSGASPEEVACLSHLVAVHPELARHAWLQDSFGLVQPFFIPGEFNTRIHDRPVRITATSEFPGDHRVHYIVQTDSLHTFRIKIRKPDWVKAITIDQPYRLEADFIVMEGPWTGFDEIDLVYVPSVTSHRTPKGERWFTFGPLVLTHPIPSTDTWTGSEPETTLISQAAEATGYQLDPSAKARRAFGSNAGDLRFSVEARNRSTGEPISIRLAPIARTTNRQTTFPFIR